MECETEMNIARQSFARSGQKQAHAAKFAFESGTGMYEKHSVAAARRDAFPTNDDVDQAHERVHQLMRWRWRNRDVKRHLKS